MSYPSRENHGVNGYSYQEANPSIQHPAGNHHHVPEPVWDPQAQQWINPQQLHGHPQQTQEHYSQNVHREGRPYQRVIQNRRHHSNHRQHHRIPRNQRVPKQHLEIIPEEGFPDFRDSDRSAEKAVIHNECCPLHYVPCHQDPRVGNVESQNTGERYHNTYAEVHEPQNSGEPYHNSYAEVCEPQDSGEPCHNNYAEVREPWQSPERTVHQEHIPVHRNVPEPQHLGGRPQSDNLEMHDNHRRMNCTRELQDQPIVSQWEFDNIKSRLEDEIVKLKAKVEELKEKLAEENQRRSRAEAETLDVQEHLGLRVSLAESQNISKETQFRCKEKMLLEKIQSKNIEIDQLKYELKEKEEELEKTKSSVNQLAANLAQNVEQDKRVIKMEWENIAVKKQYYEDEFARFESERIGLLSKIDGLTTDVREMEKKIAVKNEKIAGMRILSRSFSDEKSKLLETVATQKKRLHFQDTCYETINSLKSKVNTWESQAKSSTWEIQDLKEKISQLSEENFELKENVKKIDEAESLKEHFADVEKKAQSWFEKMLTANGEAQALRDRLAKSKELVADIENKLKSETKRKEDFAKALNENHKIWGEQVFLNKTAKTQRNLLWGLFCKLSSSQEEALSDVRRMQRETAEDINEKLQHFKDKTESIVIDYSNDEIRNLKSVVKELIEKEDVYRSRFKSYAECIRTMGCYLDVARKDILKHEKRVSAFVEWLKCKDQGSAFAEWLTREHEDLEWMDTGQNMFHINLTGGEECTCEGVLLS